MVKFEPFLVPDCCLFHGCHFQLINCFIVLFFTALEVLCPASTPKSQLNSIHPASLELFRTALSFFISTAHYKEALTLANRMADIFLAFENESSMCKMFLTITLIQLTLGDAVQAQQTYLQEHLNSNTYLGEGCVWCVFVM